VFLGLRTVIHSVSDLPSSRSWWVGVLGAEPYFDEPFYVGFDVAGFELGLMPTEGAPETITYWGARDVAVAVAALEARGAIVRDAIADVGEGIRVATLTVPDGAVIGVIENPNFAAALPAADPTAGPGR
jgi:catechol 2,3-dioxygenase-like lactoylglutathione lyase family enzyme